MLNKVMLIGNLGRDPELKTIASGVNFTEISIATTENYKDKNNQKQSKTEWHHVVVWQKAAENVCKYLRKGSKVYVEGKLTTKSWVDQNNVKHYKTEIIATTVTFLNTLNQNTEINKKVDEKSVDYDNDDLPF